LIAGAFLEAQRVTRLDCCADGIGDRLGGPNNIIPGAEQCEKLLG
jgi:hypothetical protein